MFPELQALNQLADWFFVLGLLILLLAFATAALDVEVS